MAVYVAASDERYSRGNSRNEFFYGGFLAPYTDWSGSFEALWDRNVLEGPPRIPYLHMTDIRKQAWRETEGKGITRSQGERRVRSAFELIAETRSLIPIGVEFKAGHMRDTFKEKIRLESGAKKIFMPDYLAFISYAYAALEFCYRNRPDAEKIDFVVERSSDITQHIQEFHRDLPQALVSVGLERLVPLVGDLRPGGKDRFPLQAADVLCWYSQRYREGGLNEKELRRYSVIATREGVRVDLTDHNVRTIMSNSFGKQ